MNIKKMFFMYWMFFISVFLCAGLEKQEQWLREMKNPLCQRTPEQKCCVGGLCCLVGCCGGGLQIIENKNYSENKHDGLLYYMSIVAGYYLSIEALSEMYERKIYLDGLPKKDPKRMV